MIKIYAQDADYRLFWSLIAGAGVGGRHVDVVDIGSRNSIGMVLSCSKEGGGREYKRACATRVLSWEGRLRYSRQGEYTSGASDVNPADTPLSHCDGSSLHSDRKAPTFRHSACSVARHMVGQTLAASPFGCRGLAHHCFLRILRPRSNLLCCVSSPYSSVQSLSTCSFRLDH